MKSFACHFEFETDSQLSTHVHSHANDSDEYERRANVIKTHNYLSPIQIKKTNTITKKICRKCSDEIGKRRELHAKKKTAEQSSGKNIMEWIQKPAASTLTNDTEANNKWYNENEKWLQDIILTTLSEEKWNEMSTMRSCDLILFGCVYVCVGSFKDEEYWKKFPFSLAKAFLRVGQWKCSEPCVPCTKFKRFHILKNWWCALN